jgi:hypothetical protein
MILVPLFDLKFLFDLRQAMQELQIGGTSPEARMARTRAQRGVRVGPPGNFSGRRELSAR